MKLAERSLQSPFSLSTVGPLLIAAIVILSTWLWSDTITRWPQPPRTVALTATPFAIDPAGVAPLRVAGAWRLTAPDRRFGGLSSLAIDGGRFLALSDSGVLYRFGVPGMADATVDISELPDGPGAPNLKENRDSESLARDPFGRGWWVGFETRNQIWLYDRGFTRALGRIEFGQRRWPVNLGIEAMLADPGELTLVPELAHEVVLVAKGRAVSEPLQGVGSNISDVARLPDGRMLVLLRDLEITGFRTALGILVHQGGEWRVEQRVPLQMGAFANLEGLTVQRLPSGQTRLWLVTDDNFQRPLTTTLVALDLPADGWPAGNLG